MINELKLQDNTIAPFQAPKFRWQGLCSFVGLATHGSSWMAAIDKLLDTFVVRLWGTDEQVEVAVRMIEKKAASALPHR